MTIGVVQALVLRGTDLRHANNLETAANAFLAAFAIAERLDDKVRMANILINYSSIPGQQADYDAALGALNRALAIAEEIHEEGVVASALTNLAIVHRLTGDFDRALETNRRSLELAVAAHQIATQGRVYSNMGVIYAIQGHFREALEAYEKALVLKQQVPGVPDVAVLLINMGDLQFGQGNFDLALEYFTRALTTVRSTTGDSMITASALTSIGTTYRDMGRLDRARENLEQARAIFERAGNRIGVAADLFYLASVDRLEHHLIDALAGHRKSLELREAINDRTGMVDSLDAVARAQGDLGSPAVALATAERAIAIARDLKSSELLWSPLTTAADCKRAMHDPAGAETTYREAIDAIETIRLEVAGGGESRRRFFEDKLETYHHLSTLLLEQNKVGEAFAVAERARARVLADLLSPADAVIRPLSAEERDRQRALERGVVAAAARLDAAGRHQPRSAAAITAADDALRRARLSNDEYRDMLDARYPVRRLARGDRADDPAVAAVQLLADDRTAVIEYVVTNAATFMFVATRQSGSGEQRPALAVFTVPVSKTDLRVRADAFRAKLASRALDFHPDARALYDLLMKPAGAALAGRTHLVIIPDDALWTIPFGALEPARDRPLIDTAAVSYAPSVAVLRAMRDRRRALSSREGPPRVMVAVNPESDLAGIPDADRQARALAALYGRSRAQLFVGAAATEPRVRTAAADADVLHFATHGVVDNGNPMYSFLQLTRAGQQDADSDGRLEAWEVQSMRLSATVAVLTACDTARGRVGAGEGVVGLAWAFFAAGTPATIVGLWKLESGSATTVTQRFHVLLRASLLHGRADVAANLRAAALELRRDPRYRHPYYWAALVAVGDGF